MSRIKAKTALEVRFLHGGPVAFRTILLQYVEGFFEGSWRGKFEACESDGQAPFIS